MRGIWWQQKSVCVVWVREGFLPIVTRLPSMQMDAITKKAHTMVSSVVVLTYAIQKVKCPHTIVRFKVITSSSPTIIVVICKSTSMLDDIIIQSKLLLYIFASYLPLIVSISCFIWKLHNIFKKKKMFAYTKISIVDKLLN